MCHVRTLSAHTFALRAVPMFNPTPAPDVLHSILMGTSFIPKQLGACLYSFGRSIQPRTPAFTTPLPAQGVRGPERWEWTS